MTLKNLSNSELWINTKRAAEDEKKATLTLLEYLTEIERRRLFAERAYPSLFAFVVEELGYSEAQAAERISAMRLITQVEEVKEKIHDGSLTLTTAAKIQRFLKTEKKVANKIFTSEEKRELIQSCEIFTQGAESFSKIF
jgi:hypothetical protein